MVQRGFRNDNESRMPIVSHVDRHVAIAKVMASGGLVRQALQSAGVKIDTSEWQGVPGMQVSTSLLVKALEIEDLPADRAEGMKAMATRLFRVSTSEEMHLFEIVLVVDAPPGAILNAEGELVI